MKFLLICKMLAAFNMRKAGYSVKEIAKQAEVSTTTVRRWLSNFDPIPSK